LAYFSRLAFEPLSLESQNKQIKKDKIMKLNHIAANQTEIENRDGTTILYSYQTPVAAFVPGRGALVSATKYSATTSRHVGRAVKRWGARNRVEVAQSEIDAICGS